MINKNGHSTFHTGKPGNSNSLWGNFNYVMTLLPWNRLKMRVSAKKVLWLLTSFRWNVLGHVLEAPALGIPADIVVETWVKNCTARFYNHSIEMRSCLIKSKSTETSSCICLWSNNQVLSKFNYLLTFSPCFNQMDIVATVMILE